MFYRLLIFLVTAFWVTMWALLIRSEVQPGAGVRSVPLEHVLREIFRRDEPSELWINDNGTRVGHLRLAPSIREEDRTHRIEFFGNLRTNFIGVPPQRAIWDGELVLGPQRELQRFRLGAVTRDTAKREPVPTRLELNIDAIARRGSYSVKVGEQSADQQEFTLDEAGLTNLLAHLGVDAARLKQFATGTIKAPQVTASLSSFTLHGEKLETYLVTITYNSQTILEIQVSQLGEFLHAKSLIGWTLEPN